MYSSLCTRMLGTAPSSLHPLNISATGEEEYGRILSEPLDQFLSPRDISSRSRNIYDLFVMPITPFHFLVPRSLNQYPQGTNCSLPRKARQSVYQNNFPHCKCCQLENSFGPSCAHQKNLRSFRVNLVCIFSGRLDP